MQKLIIIRHGTFDEGETVLNTEGRKQIEVLAPVLAELNPVIYSSVGPRAIESAAILASCLKRESYAFEFFGSHSRADEEKYYSEAFALIKDASENMVIVTKGEWANGFIPFFVEAVSGEDIDGVALERGEAVMIDCENGDFTQLPHTVGQSSINLL